MTRWVFKAVEKPEKKRGPHSSTYPYTSNTGVPLPLGLIGCFANVCKLVDRSNNSIAIGEITCNS